MLKRKHKNTNRGFTLLFASLAGALMLSIGLAIFTIILKELVLSSTISESQFSFAAADSGAECALYWDLEHPGFENSVFGGEPQILVPNGLVGYWKLDEGSGSTVSDSALSNDGSISGASWVTGKIDGALSFVGNDHVTISDDDSLYVGNNLTIAAWVNRDNKDLQHVVFSDLIGSEVPDAEYSLELLPSTSIYDIELFTNDNGADGSVGALGLLGGYSTGEWNHIAATWDGSDVRFYLNGNLTDVVPFSYSPVEKFGTDVRIGKRRGGAYPMDGDIDEVRLYKRALSGSEVETLAEQTEPQSSEPASQNSSLNCAGADITNPSTGWDSSSGWEVTNVTETTANVVFDMLFSDNTCATVTVDKDGATTTIESRGYNTCQAGNSRRTERGIRVTY